MPRSMIAVPKKQERQGYIKGLITGEMARYNKSKSDMALKAKCSVETLNKKIDNAGDFKVEELYAILDELQVSVIFSRKQQPL